LLDVADHLLHPKVADDQRLEHHRCAEQREKLLAVDVDGEGLLADDVAGHFAHATGPDGDVRAHRVSILSRNVGGVTHTHEDETVSRRGRTRERTVARGENVGHPSDGTRPPPHFDGATDQIADHVVQEPIGRDQHADERAAAEDVYGGHAADRRRAAVWRSAWTPASVRLAPVTRTSAPRKRRAASRTAPWTVGASGWTCQPWKSLPSYARTRRTVRIPIAAAGGATRAPVSGSSRPPRREETVRCR